MPARCPFSYAVVRVVPHVEREEFVNAGVLLFCAERDYLGSRSALDEARLLALAPDAELSLVRAHLAALPLICAGDAAGGPIALLPLRERWQWLIAPRSGVLQVSASHGGLCVDPEGELDRLVNCLCVPPGSVRRPAPPVGK